MDVCQDRREIPHRQRHEVYPAFLRPLTHPLAAHVETTVDDSDYDAIMEMWFDNQAQWEATMNLFADPGLSGISCVGGHKGKEGALRCPDAKNLR
jgi:hypothetical protein